LTAFLEVVNDDREVGRVTGILIVPGASSMTSYVEAIPLGVEVQDGESADGKSVGVEKRGL
jgi:hypothetical protein